MFLFLFSISYSFSLCPKFLHTFVMPWRKHVTILSNYSTDKFKTTRDCLYVKTAHFQVLLGIVRPWYCKNPDHSLYFVQTIDFLGCKTFDVFFSALIFLVRIFVKFIYSEKATTFFKISTLFLSTLYSTYREISKNFEAFPDYMNLVAKIIRELKSHMIPYKFKGGKLICKKILYKICSLVWML